MPLVVPILRFFVVFFNVYETFKTLKPPPPSARRGGQPSARALSQRKRDLKGCLAVWVVWCCYAAYERTLDRVVGIFLPFYSEIKSVFLLFLVLTRAKGAEPVFLHVLRPLVKPYAAIVDPILELSRDIGDFFFALLQVPLDYVLASLWFPTWYTEKPEEEFSESFSSGRTGSVDSRISALTSNQGGALHTSGFVDTRHVSIRSLFDGQRPNNCPFINPPANFGTCDRLSAIPLPAYSEDPSHDPPRYSQTLTDDRHQTWYPPTFAYSESDHVVSVSMPEPLGTAPEYRSPEWRTYPAFPSAYPPTPLPASTSLPSSAARSANDRLLTSNTPIPENEQDFGEKLERVDEGHPGSVHNSSDRDNIPPGVNDYEGTSDVTRQPDEDKFLDDSMCSSEAGLSEDDFGTSLRTPHRFSKAISSGAYSSVDSLTSALTTTDNTSPLRTKTSSDSLSSASSSLAGQKRTRVFQGRRRSTLTISDSRNATLRGRPASVVVHYDSPRSGTREDEVGSEDVGDDDSTQAKRQKVSNSLNRVSSARPAAKESGRMRKAVLSPRSVAIRIRPATNTTQGTVRRRVGSAATASSTTKGRKPMSTSRQGVRGGLQEVVKSSNAPSSQSGTLRGRAY